MPVQIDDVQGAFALFVQASQRVMAALNGPPKKLAQANRDWFLMGAYVLRAYCSWDNWPDGPNGKPREFIPTMYADAIANQLASLGVGRLPHTMRSALLKGSHAPGPVEMTDMGRAVAYLAAVREGLIADRSPIKTVANAYSVSRQTVMRWQRELSFVTPYDFNWVGPLSERGTLLASEMMKGAARYRQVGRSARAIERRARKKRV